MLAAVDRRAWDERYESADLVWSAEPNRFVEAEVGDLPPGRALDLACGEGRNAIWLASLGHEVVAVDFSGVALEKGRRIAERRGVDVQWVEADVVTDPLPVIDGTVDLVLICYLQLPPEPRRRVLAAAEAALAPGGTLLVVAHDRTNIEEGVGGPQDPNVLCGPEDVAAALATLEVTRAARVERPVPTDDGMRAAIDLLVRAHRPA